MSTETMETKISPLPWRVDEIGRDLFIMGKGTGDFVADLQLKDCFYEERETCKVNAAHIVKCVNNHDLLVSALNAVAGALNHDDVNVADIHAAIRYAHNALDTVEGGAA